MDINFEYYKRQRNKSRGRSIKLIWKVAIVIKNLQNILCGCNRYNTIVINMLIARKSMINSHNKNLVLIFRNCLIHKCKFPDYLVTYNISQ